MAETLKELEDIKNHVGTLCIMNKMKNGNTPYPYVVREVKRDRQLDLQEVARKHDFDTGYDLLRHLGFKVNDNGEVEFDNAGIPQAVSHVTDFIMDANKYEAEREAKKKYYNSYYEEKAYEERVPYEFASYLKTHDWNIIPDYRMHHVPEAKQEEIRQTNRNVPRPLVVEELKPGTVFLMNGNKRQIPDVLLTHEIPDPVQRKKHFQAAAKKARKEIKKITEEMENWKLIPSVDVTRFLIIKDPDYDYQL